MLRTVFSMLATVCAIAGAVTGFASENVGQSPEKPEIYINYGEAYRTAAAQNRMLLIYFHQPATSGAVDAFESQVLMHESLASRRDRYVVAKLPVSVTGVVGGKTISLLKHPAFGEMHGCAGVAIIDLANRDSQHYGRVVSVFPFKSGRRFGRQELAEMLDLPPGSLTQRTLIFAVRIHPERPASTEGRFSAVLASETESHSRHQAAIGVQGHHNWDYRFQNINSQLGLTAQEVCAESWPGQDLVDAAIECVDSWRQSPGHWSAVRSRNSLFGFDMKRGRNGIWYGTGIFARR